MKHSTDRILTTHTGSLHRQPVLEEILRKSIVGEAYDDAALEANLKSGVADIVKKQMDLGVDIINDGELCKVSFIAYAKYRMEGLEARRATSPYFDKRMTTVMASEALRAKFADFYRDSVLPDGSQMVQLWTPAGTAQEPPAIYSCVEKLRYNPLQVTRDIANLKVALNGYSPAEVFMPGVAPAMFASRHPNEFYASEDEYYYACADAMREEYMAIVNAGFVLQIDDVSLPGARRVFEGEAFTKWCDRAVDTLNYALRDIPPEKVRYHMCWSSQNSPHIDDAPLEELLPFVLKINAQAYHIESANVRHEHEWKIWKDTKLPDDKILMPGVICHATNVVEHPEYVAERIQRFTSLLGRERVVAATDCGFRLRVHPQIAWAKLESLVEGAKLASKQLWLT